MNTARSHSLPLVLSALFGVTVAGCGGVPPKASPDDPAGNFSQVSQGIYRGGRPDEAGIAALVKLGVKAVIDLENDDLAVQTEKGWVEKAGMIFIQAPMNGMDVPNDEEVMRVEAHLADPNLRPIFIHCMKGQDRTGAMVAIYRVFHEGWTAADAIHEMESLGFNDMLFSLKGYVKQKLGL